MQSGLQSQSHELSIPRSQALSFGAMKGFHMTRLLVFKLISSQLSSSHQKWSGFEHEKPILSQNQQGLQWPHQWVWNPTTAIILLWPDAVYSVGCSLLMLPEANEVLCFIQSIPIQSIQSSTPVPFLHLLSITISRLKGEKKGNVIGAKIMFPPKQIWKSK